MKKLYLGVLLSASLFFGACTNAEIDSFFNTLAELGKTTLTTAVSKSDSALGKHHHYISLPATPYYPATEIEVRREFTEGQGIWASRADIQVKGEIFNEGGQLTLKLYAPVYDVDRKIVGRIRREQSLASRGIMTINLSASHTEANDRTPRLYIPRDEVILAVYHNGKLVGSSHPEMLQSNTKSTSNSTRTTTKTNTKTNTNKVYNTQTNTRKNSSHTSSTMTSGNTMKTQTQTHSQSQTQTRSSVNTSTKSTTKSSSMQTRQSL